MSVSTQPSTWEKVVHSYNGGEDPNQLRVPYGQSGNNVTGDPTQDVITSLTDSSGTTTAFTFDNDENLQASTAPVNDMQGVSAFGYDPIDRLTSWNYMVGANQGPSDSMKYNVEGLRSFKASTAGITGYSLTKGAGQSSFYVYDGDQLIAEIDPVLGGTQNAYLWGATGLAMQVPGGNVSVNAYTFDPQGNRCGMVTYGFRVTAANPCLFDGYGQIIQQPGTLRSVNSQNLYSDPIGYKGQVGCYTDVESGLVYCQNRYYSPQMGRWLTKDPIGAEGGINVYEFCGNNPIMFADPSGLQEGEEGESDNELMAGELIRGLMELGRNGERIIREWRGDPEPGDEDDDGRVERPELPEFGPVRPPPRFSETESHHILARLFARYIRRKYGTSAEIEEELGRTIRVVKWLHRSWHRGKGYPSEGGVRGGHYNNYVFQRFMVIEARNASTGLYYHKDS